MIFCLCPRELAKTSFNDLTMSVFKLVVKKYGHVTNIAIDPTEDILELI